jgi:hypothetical protein
MSILNDILNSIGGFIREYTTYCSFCIVATLLVIYGDEINNFVRNRIKHLHFVIRVFIFILISAFAYGLVTVICTEFLNIIFKNMSNIALIPIMVAIFIVIGTLAERKQQV